MKIRFMRNFRNSSCWIHRASFFYLWPSKVWWTFDIESKSFYSINCRAFIIIVNIVFHCFRLWRHILLSNALEKSNSFKLSHCRFHPFLLWSIPSSMSRWKYSSCVKLISLACVATLASVYSFCNGNSC